VGKTTNASQDAVMGRRKGGAILEIPIRGTDFPGKKRGGRSPEGGGKKTYEKPKTEKTCAPSVWLRRKSFKQIKERGSEKKEVKIDNAPEGGMKGLGKLGQGLDEVRICRVQKAVGGILIVP